ncbi:4Fe-4S dicluster domain-containing protein [candidate division KSB1 bacterium]|nr:4Fe-4S dicluster domain-containing protein [candidate division KSB1 bacterium]NIR72874.1 4Fe-4S dicluster domain-containing protein [candidate division KSB1 bacterium]NIS25151.1 4Fe-4S dicluster domain-containing protein [candidate division KSB1 bacterium]NIT72062.1 4Fe-4S dicluster domain-containing protein [candidate division KSB1 bacterium]NIU25853.1 4Fe-4S dicluster domain-containing protein [candidate division KSB1 bacterium]
MLSYFSNIYRGLVTIAIGMAQTWKALMRPSITLQYPTVKWQLPTNARGILFNNVDDCIGCYKCARVCPVQCIYIDTVKAAPEEDLGKASMGNPIRQHVVRFDIDMFKCCYCDFCTVVCPTECLYMTDEYENAVYSRENGIYHFAKYSPEEARALIEREQREEMEKAKAKEAALAAKKAPGKDKKERRPERGKQPAATD